MQERHLLVFAPKLRGEGVLQLRLPGKGGHSSSSQEKKCMVKMPENGPVAVIAGQRNVGRGRGRSELQYVLRISVQNLHTNRFLR
jgi:hypothetical protein